MVSEVKEQWQAELISKTPFSARGSLAIGVPDVGAISFPTEVQLNIE